MSTTYDRVFLEKRRCGHDRSRFFTKARLCVSDSKAFRRFRSTKIYEGRDVPVLYATSLRLRAYKGGCKSRDGDGLLLGRFDDVGISTLKRSFSRVCGAASYRASLEGRLCRWNDGRDGQSLKLMFLRCRAQRRHDESGRRCGAVHSYDRVDEPFVTVDVRFAHAHRDEMCCLRKFLVETIFEFVFAEAARIDRKIRNRRKAAANKDYDYDGGQDATLAATSGYVRVRISDEAFVDDLYEEGLQRRQCRLNKADRLETVASSSTKRERKDEEESGALFCLRHAREKEGRILTNLECSVAALKGRSDCLAYAHRWRALAEDDPLDRRTCVYAAASASVVSCGDSEGCIEYALCHRGRRYTQEDIGFPTAVIKALVWNVPPTSRTKEEDYCGDREAKIENVSRCFRLVSRLSSEHQRQMIEKQWHGARSSQDARLNSFRESARTTRCSSVNALKRVLGQMASVRAYGRRYVDDDRINNGQRRRLRAPPWTKSPPGTACCLLRKENLWDIASILSVSSVERRYAAVSHCHKCADAILQSAREVSSSSIPRLLAATRLPLDSAVLYLFQNHAHSSVWHPDARGFLLRTAMNCVETCREKYSYSHPERRRASPLSSVLLMRFWIRVSQRRRARLRRQTDAASVIQRFWKERAYAPGGWGFWQAMHDLYTFTVK